ncbi:hypothetical protein BJ912DRAFT_148511 [Pholiota molesta]|nr:hypothetical protein BJ912DRAFT_148511 [Pholiota molesta]
MTSAQQTRHPLITESLNEKISIEEAHEQIDKAINGYQEIILALKSQRNRYAPISRLPPEILCRIFSFAKTQWQDVTYYRSAMGIDLHPMKWIRLTHVTRHWRNIALNSPSLWVEFPFGNRSLVEEMLKRSKHAGLVIKSDFSSIRTIRPGLELALKHIGRAKDLSFQGITSNVWKDLQKLLSEPTPRLQYLTLNGYATHSEPISITGRVLCETGWLRHLELTNCNFNWTSHSHILCSLSHLKLHNIPYSSRPNAKQFVDIMKGMPDLEFLDLKDVLPVQTPEQVPWPSDRIHFASLRILKICSTNNELEPFFSCVTFPPTAAVNIVCSATDTSANTPISTNRFSGFIVSLGGLYSNCSSTRIFQTIVLRQLDLRGSAVQLELYTDELFHDLRYNTSNPSLELQFRGMPRFSAKQDAENLLFDIFNGGVHLQHVKQVFLVDMSEVDGRTIAKTFGMLPCVRSVVAASVAVGPFINALKFCSQDDDMKPTTVNPHQPPISLTSPQSLYGMQNSTPQMT